MKKDINPDDILNWLAQETKRVAHNISPSIDITPYIWAIAVDMLDWLRQAPAAERDRVMIILENYLDGREVLVEMPTFETQMEQEGFVTLLRFVVKPPGLL